MSILTINDNINLTGIMDESSFVGLVSISKSVIEDSIMILMFHSRVSVFGYNKNNDEYWGEVKNLNKNIVRFSLHFIKLKDKETRCIISIFNSNYSDSKNISTHIFSNIKNIETCKSIYREATN